MTAPFPGCCVSKEENRLCCQKSARPPLPPGLASRRTIGTRMRISDVFVPITITAGKKSVAYSLMFRSPEGTLTDAEIEPALKKIFKSLHEKGCILRS